MSGELYHEGNISVHWRRVWMISAIIYHNATSLLIFTAIYTVAVYNTYDTSWLWRCRGFLTRKMSRVTVISTPLIASFCQVLLELLGLVGGLVPLIRAIEVTSNWRWAEIWSTVMSCHRCIDFYGNCSLEVWSNNLFLPLTKCAIAYKYGLNMW